MAKRKILKISLLIIGIGVFIVMGVAYYQFNLPHRDVQALEPDYSYTSSDIVNEYLTNPEAANEKYLDEEGESKILEIYGEVAEISRDFNDQKVILLKSKEDKAGVSFTFTKETEASSEKVLIGNYVTIKGVIRSGANFDKDLELYEHVIVEKSTLINK